jgi:hypothetical protein
VIADAAGLRFVRAGAPLVAAAIALGGTACGSSTQVRHQRSHAPLRQTGRLGTQESLGGVPVPFAHQEFHVTNMWLGNRGPYSVDVYAGYPPFAPRQGQLRLMWIDNRIGTPDEKRSGTFVPPGRPAGLRITAVRGDIVAFAYRGGHGTFNLVTHRFRPAA